MKKLFYEANPKTKGKKGLSQVRGSLLVMKVIGPIYSREHRGELVRPEESGVTTD